MEPILEPHTSGVKIWRMNNGFHREDGPAVVDADGNACEYWAFNLRYESLEELQIGIMVDQ